MAAVLVGLLSSLAGAHDLLPPSWRGQEGSTYQEWDFLTSADPAAPDVIDNPYGTAVADIAYDIYGEGWLYYFEELGDQVGYWDIGTGSITVDIDNRPEPLPYKEVWVQVTYYQHIHDAPEITVPGGEFQYGDTVLVDSAPNLGAWYLDLSVWRIEPNPVAEQVIFDGVAGSGAIIDQIVIDTICVPEPSAAALLMLGLVAVRRRR
jgi:hypothetical protein